MKRCLLKPAFFLAGGGTDSAWEQEGTLHILPPILTTRQPAVCRRAGGAGSQVGCQHGGPAPPPAALPPFTAVAHGPIPAELHPGSSLRSPRGSHCLGLVSERPLTNFSILLLMESSTERNESLLTLLVIQEHALLCQFNA